MAGGGKTYGGGGGGRGGGRRAQSAQRGGGRAGGSVPPSTSRGAASTSRGISPARSLRSSSVSPAKSRRGSGESTSQQRASGTYSTVQASTSTGPMNYAAAAAAAPPPPRVNYAAAAAATPPPPVSYAAAAAAARPPQPMNYVAAAAVQPRPPLNYAAAAAAAARLPPPVSYAAAAAWPPPQAAAPAAPVSLQSPAPPQTDLAAAAKAPPQTAAAGGSYLSTGEGAPGSPAPPPAAPESSSRTTSPLTGVRRPDSGGKSGDAISLVANHFLVSECAEIIYQYSVKITKPPRPENEKGGEDGGGRGTGRGGDVGGRGRGKGRGRGGQVGGGAGDAGGRGRGGDTGGRGRGGAGGGGGGGEAAGGGTGGEGSQQQQQQQKAPRELSGFVLREVQQKWLAKYERELGCHPVFDGVGILYAAKRLFDESQTERLYNDIQMGPNDQVFHVALKLSATPYLEGGAARYRRREPGDEDLPPVPQEFLMALNLVLSEQPARNLVAFGRNFFDPGRNFKFPLDNGVEMWEGFSHSIRHTQQGLALTLDRCLDIFYTPGYCSFPTYLEYWFKRVRNQRYPEQLSYDCEWDPKFIALVATALVGLKFTVNHRACSQVLTVRELTSVSAADDTFVMKEKVTTTVAEYLTNRYPSACHGVYWNWPCVVSQAGRFPIQFCDLAPNQRCRNEPVVNALQRDFLKHCIIGPGERRAKLTDIMKQAPEKHPARGPYVQDFGITVSNEMTKVEGRCLPAPPLVLKNPNDQRDKPLPAPREGRWIAPGWKPPSGSGMSTTWLWAPNTKIRWRVVNLADREPPQGHQHGSTAPQGRSTRQSTAARQTGTPFTNNLYQCAQNMGMIHMEVLPTRGERYVTIERRSNPQTENQALHALTKVFTEEKESMQTGAAKGLTLIIIVILKDQRDGLYKLVKRAADQMVGILTQCVTKEKLDIETNVKSPTSPYLQNLLLKINMKCGGRNVKLDAAEVNGWFGWSRSGSPAQSLMVLGADVTHGRPSTATPGTTRSIAAVVGSVDKELTRYATRVSVQPGEGVEEIIQDLTESVRQLAELYMKGTKGGPPIHVLFFRDGVGEGQFQTVRDSELRAIVQGLEQAAHVLAGGDTQYSPKVTMVLVQKRHRTRLFLDDTAPRGGAGVGRGKSSTAPLHQRRGGDSPAVDKKGINVPPGTVVDGTITHPRNFDFYMCSHQGTMGTSKPCHYYVLRDDNGFSSDGLQKAVYALCHLFGRCCHSVSLVAPVLYAHLAAKRARAYALPSSDTPATHTIIDVHANIRDTMFFL